MTLERRKEHGIRLPGVGDYFLKKMISDTSLMFEHLDSSLRGNDGRTNWIRLWLAGAEPSWRISIRPQCGLPRKQPLTSEKSLRGSGDATVAISKTDG